MFLVESLRSYDASNAFQRCYFLGRRIPSVEQYIGDVGKDHATIRLESCLLTYDWICGMLANPAAWY